MRQGRPVEIGRRGVATALAWAVPLARRLLVRRVGAERFCVIAARRGLLIGRLSGVLDAFLDVVLLIAVILPIRAISDLDISFHLAVFVSGDSSDSRVCPTFNLFLDTFLLIMVHLVFRDL
jgi:hypothetical protein